MKIEYLGHSCFKLTDGRGVSVVCDPYDSSIGYAMAEVSADFVTVSHHHYDHDNVGAVTGSPKVIDKSGEYEFNGIKFSGTDSFHDTCRGRMRGGNVIYKFLIDGITVCHLGDIGEPASERLISQIAPADVLLVPVGGTYTVDAAEAKRFVDGVSPKLVIPMHYSCEGGKIDIEGVDRFLGLFESSKVERLNESRLEINADDLVGGLQIKVLRRR